MNRYQEALDYIVENSCPSHTNCSQCQIKDVCNCQAKSKIDVLQALIDNTDRYRWHDLRKDPNDLPETHAPVNVWLGGGFYYAGSWTNYNAFFVDGNGDMSKEEVIAWKYIEEFDNE